MTDAIFTIGGIVFIVGLLPAVFDPKTSIPLKTSVPIAIVLAVYSFTFLRMGLMWSSVSSSITCACWTIIAIERSP